MRYDRLGCPWSLPPIVPLSQKIVRRLYEGPVRPVPDVARLECKLHIVTARGISNCMFRMYAL